MRTRIPASAIGPVLFVAASAAVSARADDCSERIRERRADTIIMLHRGAADLAIENTLAAYEASFLAGGDGLEIDIQRAADGTLVMFHDPWIDRLLDGWGKVEGLTYDELLLHGFRDPYGLTRPGERVPTLEETLDLCRRYCGAIHLDIKVEGIDGRVLAALEERDLLEHVVTVNAYNSDAVRADARIRPAPSQGSLIHGNNDFDGRAIDERLRSGAKGTLLVDDPRAAVAALGRRGRGEVSPGFLPPLTPPSQGVEELVTIARGSAASVAAGGELSRRQALARLVLHHPEAAALHVSAELARAPAPVVADWVWAAGRLAARGTSVDEVGRRRLLELLREGIEKGGDERLLEEVVGACGELRLAAALDRIVAVLRGRGAASSGFALDAERAAADAARIRLRAAAARALRLLGTKRPDIADVLGAAVAERSFHVEGALHALDAAEAARALAALGASDAVHVLRDAALRVDPRLAAMESHEEYPWWLRQSGAWWDFRLKTASIAALGRFGTSGAREALESFLAIPAERAEKLWRELHWDAARALCSGSYELTAVQLRALFEHPTPAVRRTAALYALRHRRPEIEGLVAEFLPWAKSS